MREILHQKVLSGEFIGSSAPFGYQKSPENPHKLILKEPEASIVRELFEAYAAGTSVKELVKNCQQKHIHLQMLKQAGAAEAFTGF